MKKTDLTYLVEILSKHLKAASVRFRVEELQLCLLSCPTDVSALSIVQTYTCLGAKTNVFRADFESILKWGKPFLGQFNRDGKDSFVFVEHLSDSNVVFYEGNLKKVISIEDFLKEWTGIAVAIENPKEMNWKRKWQKAFICFALLFSCVAVSSFIHQYLPMSASIDCFLDIFGGILCFGVLIQSSSPYYNVFDHFCIANTKFDCQKLDLGKWGMLFRKANWGRIGFIYFISCALATLLAFMVSDSLLVFGCLSVISICGLFIAVVSISYQLFAKKFCLLCLGIMGVLIIKGSLAVLVIDAFLFFSLDVGIFFLMIGLISCGFLYVIEYIFTFKQRCLTARVNELLIKRKQNILEKIFMTKSVLQTDNNSIKIGNSNAPLTITTYLSPWCKTCKKIAFETMSLLVKYPDYVNWQIYLDGIKADKVNEMNMPQLSLYCYFRNEKDPKRKLEMLKYWYKTKSVKGLLSKMKVKPSDFEASLMGFNNQLSAMENWKKVPMVWINNRIFPSCYSLMDLPYMLLDLCMIYSQKQEVCDN